MDTLAAIDSPARGSLNDPLALRVEGWLHTGPRGPDLAAIEISAAGQFADETSRHLLAACVSRVEVLTYGVHPLTTPEGLPIHSHLFAICEP